MVSGWVAARGPWVSRRAVIEDSLKFFAVVSGRARLGTDGIDRPIELERGDVAILNNRSWLQLDGGTGTGPRREILPETDFSAARRLTAERDADDVVVGGHVELNPAGEALLLQVLPPVGHVRAATAAATTLRGSLDRLFEEASGQRIGFTFAIRQYGQLLLLDTIRAYLEQVEMPPGWLRLVTDERLRPALTLIHTEPGKPWRLPELARAASLSRTSFAERFHTVAGIPPLTYLNQWRMLLAQRALRDSDVRVRSLAAELGYGSESAFSMTFKREVGVSPLRYRNHVRQELPAGSE